MPPSTYRMGRFCDKRRAQILISVFVFFHLFATANEVLARTVKLPLALPSRIYIHALGLYQNWSMFEHVQLANYYLCALVLMKSGAKTYVDFGHMEKLDFFSRLRLHRFRKFQQSSIFNPKNTMLYPQVCRWIFQNLDLKTQQESKKLILYEKEVPLSTGQETMRPFFEFKVPF